jgi:hypothetical protein
VHAGYKAKGLHKPATGPRWLTQRYPACSLPSLLLSPSAIEQGPEGSPPIRTNSDTFHLAARPVASFRFFPQNGPSSGCFAAVNPYEGCQSRPPVCPLAFYGAGVIGQRLEQGYPPGGSVPGYIRNGPWHTVTVRDHSELPLRKRRCGGAGSGFGQE